MCYFIEESTKLFYFRRRPSRLVAHRRRFSQRSADRRRRQSRSSSLEPERKGAGLTDERKGRLLPGRNQRLKILVQNWTSATWDCLAEEKCQLKNQNVFDCEKIFCQIKIQILNFWLAKPIQLSAEICHFLTSAAQPMFMFGGLVRISCDSEAFKITSYWGRG